MVKAVRAGVAMVVVVLVFIVVAVVIVVVVVMAWDVQGEQGGHSSESTPIRGLVMDMVVVVVVVVDVDMVVVVDVDVDKISKVEAIVRSPLGAFEVMMQLYD